VADILEREVNRKAVLHPLRQRNKLSKSSETASRSWHALPAAALPHLGGKVANCHPISISHWDGAAQEGVHHAQEGTICRAAAGQAFGGV
jgi:hypothetical protein